MRTRFLVFLTPILLYGLWLVVRVARGRHTPRFLVTTSLSLVLLLYFVVVVGTGVFWVAAQELPVFDWHYLPGYVLLVLGLLHVALHWRTVLLLFHAHAPRAVMEPDRHRFRAWVRVAGYAAVAGGLGVVIFFIGVRQGSQRITLLTQDAARTSAAKGRRLAREPLVASATVRTGSATMTLAEMYHQGSSYPQRVPLPALTLSGRPAAYKEYPQATSVPLPDSASTGGGDVLRAFRAWASGGAGAKRPTLDLARLSTLLFHAQGLTGKLAVRNMTFELRAAPSAGALYPVNVYVFAENVEGITPGLYYYHPRRSALLSVSGDPDVGFKLAELSGSPELFDDAPAIVVFTATIGRTAFKYRERAYRYVAMDTGHAAYNLAVGAAAVGLRAPMIARFDDRALAVALGLDTAEEIGLLVVPLGGSRSASREPLFDREPVFEAGSSGSSVFDLVHHGTSLRLRGGWGDLPRHPAAPAEGASVPLPGPAAGASLWEAIRARRSVREYTGEPVKLEEVSALLAASSGEDFAPGTSDPLLRATSPLNLYLSVRDVEGLRPGIYRYVPKDHALQLVREGDFSRECMAASLQQEFCGTANVVFIKTVRWQDLLYPDGDRGYRYACLRAGAVGEGLYVQGTALGLGMCGVGAFRDTDVGALLGLDLGEEVPLYLTTAGRARRPR